jgi:hypothetical protein
MPVPVNQDIAYGWLSGVRQNATALRAALGVSAPTGDDAR